MSGGKDSLATGIEHIALNADTGDESQILYHYTDYNLFFMLCCFPTKNSYINDILMFLEYWC